MKETVEIKSQKIIDALNMYIENEVLHSLLEDINVALEGFYGNFVIDDKAVEETEQTLRGFLTLMTLLYCANKELNAIFPQLRKNEDVYSAISEKGNLYLDFLHNEPKNKKEKHDKSSTN